MKTLEIRPGRYKDGTPELTGFTMQPGECYTIVGNTGSGKSRFIKDIELLAQGDTVTGRCVLIDGQVPAMAKRMELQSQLIAHLGQNMRFMLDMPVGEFIALHCQTRNKSDELLNEVLALANSVTDEPIALTQELNTLSGGQSRALMIADIAIVCDSPLVLIDEIENAGINKARALELLTGVNKLVLIVTHDVHTALMASNRIVIQNGGVHAVVRRSKAEEALASQLLVHYRQQLDWQKQLRQGESLAGT
jgi:ABC-type lipoprotein export system ATPase subunit